MSIRDVLHAPGVTTKTKGVLRHAPSPPPNVVRDGVRHVKRDTTPLVVQRGWTRRGNIWSGFYATKFGTWQGEIERRGDIFEPRIKSPPTAMQAHPKWQCFHKRTGGWWAIHLHTNPVGADDAAVSSTIAYVERLLHEAITTARKQGTSP